MQARRPPRTEQETWQGVCKTQLALWVRARTIRDALLADKIAAHGKRRRKIGSLRSPREHAHTPAKDGARLQQHRLWQLLSDAAYTANSRRAINTSCFVPFCWLSHTAESCMGAVNTNSHERSPLRESPHKIKVIKAVFTRHHDPCLSTAALSWVFGTHANVVRPAVVCSPSCRCCRPGASPAFSTTGPSCMHSAHSVPCSFLWLSGVWSAAGRQLAAAMVLMACTLPKMRPSGYKNAQQSSCMPCYQLSIMVEPCM